MASDEQRPRIVRTVDTAAGAQQRIRNSAKDTALLRWTDHVRFQMAERGLDVDDILAILRTGFVDEQPEPGDGTGVKAKITLRLKVGREASVVVALNDQRPNLTLVTAFWVDGK